MSISAAMYAAVTGLSALSTGMQVISNNIANVNTVGFKASRTNFEDLISQDFMSNGRINQIGRGVKVSTIQQMFTQGSFMNSEQDTDMAIAGEGFFQVRDKTTGDLVYTRAGDFTLDADGLMENQAGYVLQGWEMAVPSPGADPVRIGVPTDVKITVLNAPPLETSRIKVVVNLNADDNSAYIYSSAGFGEMYADQLARGPAEAARSAAAAAVYSSADGTTYLNPSSAFNRAYVAYMSAAGYHADPPGSTNFEKTTIANPTSDELTAARNSASAVAWALFTLLTPQGQFPVSTTSSAYTHAYNSAYVRYMSGLGFSYTAPDTFERGTWTLATAADKTAASAAGMASAGIAVPGYAGYGGGSAPGDAVYASAYTHYMESIGYIRPQPYYETTPATPSTLASAAAAGFAAASAVNASYGGYPQGAPDGAADLAYAAAYAARMEASGHALSNAYAAGPLPAIAVPASFIDAASGAAQTATETKYTGYPGYNEPGTTSAQNLYYLYQLLDGMPASVELSASSTWLSLPAVPIPTVPTALATTDPDYVDASAAGAAAAGAGYVYDPAGNPVSALAYLAAFQSYLQNSATVTGLNVDMTLPAAEPAAADFAVSPSALAAADAAGLAAAGAGYTVFPSVAPNVDRAGDLAYADAWTKHMASLGLEADPAYAGPPDITAAAYDQRPVTAVERILGGQASNAAAVAAGAPVTYSYPSGNPAWDAAYLGAYNGYFPAGATSRLDIDGFKTFVPTPAQIDKAEEAGDIAGIARLGSFSSYPSQSPDVNMRNAFNGAYVQKMDDLGYDPILPEPTTPPYFQRTAATPAGAPEIETAEAAAKAAAELAARNAGQAAYDQVYDYLFDSALAGVRDLIPEWQLEGMGFAGAWDGTDLQSPIDPEDYTYANPWTIYDSLGTAHTLMVYYQPNPYMENVWDYLITCDPTEDARKDINNSVAMNGASFAGVVQKGKLTFTADGPDGHGGLIKDIEAQNIDLTKTARAVLSSASAQVSLPATASSMNYFHFGGYYKGSPEFSATTGSLVQTKREYTITWTGNLGTVPNVSGFTWADDAGNDGTIPVTDKNYTGPYTFGSGLTVSFHDGGTPMRFTVGDSLNVTANSEALAWTNLTPNEDGYFDFDVAFVQSASMALHPPYPDGLPTITQHISLDMGAKFANSSDPDDDRWILDEQSTTQYATKSINIFASQDGYPPGSLQRISITSDGILTGIYTNGRQQPLYMIGLTRFINPWGLAKLGDNVYMETRASGLGSTNPPGYGGNGTVRANFLEQSNVDLANEIVNMIVTQRGFQANSKVVTTTDTMLAEVIEMKR
ncbi:MAG: flagellar hook-basal body complex protein [Deltaproteobacteria bacterium]|jgi:flagellar hook-basal body protein|nr:flagellar hook-basal body complex protein [Deltaproteobacteria bacterium]